MPSFPTEGKLGQPFSWQGDTKSKPGPAPSLSPPVGSPNRKQIWSLRCLNDISEGKYRKVSASASSGFSETPSDALTASLWRFDLDPNILPGIRGLVLNISDVLTEQ